MPPVVAVARGSECFLGRRGLRQFPAGPPLFGSVDAFFLCGYHDQARRTPMSIIRLIHIKIDPSEIEKATRIWKTECASLMIRQKGCVSEKLLRCRDAPEFISYSEWDSDAAIEAYRNSEAHKEIVRHTRGLKGAKAEVKLYELVQ
jgi:heme-degrading monooxygenase HmoA